MLSLATLRNWSLDLVPVLLLAELKKNVFARQSPCLILISLVCREQYLRTKACQVRQILKRRQQSSRRRLDFSLSEAAKFERDHRSSKGFVQRLMRVEFGNRLQKAA